jgi:hypothetical protein
MACALALRLFDLSFTPADSIRPYGMQSTSQDGYNQVKQFLPFIIKLASKT